MALHAESRGQWRFVPSSRRAMSMGDLERATALFEKQAKSAKDVGKSVASQAVKWTAIAGSIASVVKGMAKYGGSQQLQVSAKIRREQGFIGDALQDQVDSYKSIVSTIPLIGGELSSMIQRQYAPLIKFAQKWRDLTVATLNSVQQAASGNLSLGISATGLGGAQTGFLQQQAVTAIMGRARDRQLERQARLKAKTEKYEQAVTKVGDARWHDPVIAQLGIAMLKTKTSTLRSLLDESNKPGGLFQTTLGFRNKEIETSKSLADRKFNIDIARSMKVSQTTVGGTAVGLPGQFAKPEITQIGLLNDQLEVLKEINISVSKEETTISGLIG